MMSKLRGLILDFDGTVAQTERYGQRIAYNLAFKDLGLGWTWDEDLYGELLSVAGGKERLRHYLERYRPELLDEAGKEALIVDLHRAKIRNFVRIAPTIPLRRGVRRLVAEAQAAGWRVAIATTASRAGVEALLAQDPALPPMIDLIAANEAVERKKPAPDVYVWALERLRLAASDCVAIEDSNVGLRSALGAGLPTVVTVSDYTSADDFAGATAVLTDLGDPSRPAKTIRGIAPANGIADLAYLEAVRLEASRAT